MTEARTLTEWNAGAVAKWCGGSPVIQHNALDPEDTITGVNVLTADGVKRAQPGDTIIREHDGTYRIIDRAKDL